VNGLPVVAAPPQGVWINQPKPSGILVP
jgi:hypothetical protein